MTSNQNKTVVLLNGCIERGACRYCKETNAPNAAWFMKSQQMTVDDFQSLCERGWRRSGYLCYKPVNKINCCPCYPVRCDAFNFQLSRSNRKALTTFVGFLNDGIETGLDDCVKSSAKKISDIPASSEINPYSSVDADCCNKFASIRQLLNAKLGHFVDSGISLEQDDYSPASEVDQSESECEIVVAQQTDRRNGSSKRRRWIALQERMRVKSEREGIPLEKLMEDYLVRRKKRLEKNQPKTMEYFLSKIKLKEEAKHFIEMRLCPTAACTPENEKLLREEFDIFRRYVCHVHGALSGEVTYEDFIHKFVESPLIFKDTGAGASTELPAFGSYHQQYWLDGKKMIAVGIIDIMPAYVSSSYFFYDPVYEFLHLGSVSALYEIGIVRRLNRLYGPDSKNPLQAFSAFRYYTLGFYIHSSSKMNYKGQFAPSYLCCPETFTWQPIAKCKRLLDISPYSRLAPPSVLSTPLAGNIAKKLWFLVRQTDSGEDSLVTRSMADLETEEIISSDFAKMALDWAVGAVGPMCLDGRFLVLYNCCGCRT